MKLFSNIFTKLAVYKIKKELKKLGYSEKDLNIDPKKLSLEKIQQFKALFDKFLADNPHLQHLKEELNKDDPEVLIKHKQAIERWLQKNRKQIKSLLDQLR